MKFKLEVDNTIIEVHGAEEYQVVEYLMLFTNILKRKGVKDGLIYINTKLTESKIKEVHQPDYVS